MSGTAQAGEPSSKDKGAETIRHREDSQQMVNRKRIEGIEFRAKETDGANNYDSFELVLKGKIVGFLYLRKEENIEPIELKVKGRTIIETQY